MTRRRSCLALGLLCGITAAMAAMAAMAEAAGPALTADQVLTSLCASALARPATQLDLERADQEASDLQDRGDPRAVDLACEGWAAARSRSGELHLDTVRWIGNLGIGLFTRRRSEEAALLLHESHARAVALGSTALPLARRAASVLSIVHVQRQEMDAALAWSTRATEGLDLGAAPTQDSLRLQLQHATLLSMSRRHDEARTLYAALWEQVKPEPERWASESVAVLHQWAVAERRQSRLEDALRINTLNIEFQRRWTPGQRQNLALAIHNQGLLMRALARFDEAEALLREAVQGRRAAAQPDLFQAGASIRDTLSSLLVERGRPAEALALAREAVALVQAGPEAGTGAAMRPLRRQAEAQAALGDLAGATDSWRQVLAILESRPDAGDTDTRILAWLSYARSMLLLGDAVESERASAKAEAELAGKPSPPDERAGRLHLRASIKAALGQPDEALALLDEADRAWAELHPPTHPARVRVAAMSCQLARGCQVLADMNDERWPPDTRADRALALAAFSRRSGDAAAAALQARRALQAAHESGDPSLLWRSLHTQARVLADAGRGAEASFFGKTALTVLQSLRTNLRQAGARNEERYLRDKAALYREVADGLLAQQRLSEALEVMRLLKASEQADFSERAGPAGAAPSLTADERRLQQLLDHALAADSAPGAELQHLRELARAQRITAAEQQRLAALEQDLAERQQRLAGSVEAALAAIREAAAALPARPAASLARAGLAPARPGELRAWLLVTERELVALFASARRQWVERVPLEREAPLAREIAELIEHLQQRRPSLALQQSLYRRVGRLVDQAAAHSGSRRVLLWLDGPLRYLPMGLLHDGRRHLAEKLVVSTSGSDLASSHGSDLVAGSGSGQAGTATPPGAGARALPLQAFGVTRAHQGLPALPGVADELCGIVDGPVRGLDPVPSGCRAGASPAGLGPMKGQADVDQRFTEAELRAATHQAGVLHIGTHFVLRPGNVSRSWLMLGDGQRLPLQRLQALALGAPRLVTLSACDTAVPGAAADGREIDGLANTWLAKGASEVLASLWRVDDRDTARFMQRFYRELARHPADAALALHLAQRSAVRNTVGATHWGAFTLLVGR